MTRDLPLWMHSIESRLKAVERARALTNASLDNHALPVYDRDGQLQMTLGRQADGTFGQSNFNPVPPPVPALPTVASFNGGLTVTFSGATADGEPWPLDFRRVEIHVSADPGAGADFECTDATQVAAWLNTKGGVFPITDLTPGDTHWVRLVAVNTSEKESAPTAAVDGVPTSAVSGEEIDALNEAVQDAIESLDLKGAVFFNNPTTGDPVPTATSADDLWFRPDQGHAGYRWDGDTWEPILFGTAAFLAESVTEELIADGAVTNAKIVELDAGKINAGHIDAARIAALSIDTAHLAANAVTAEKIDVGAITADKLDAGAVTADKLDADAITGKTITGGQIIGAEVTGATVQTADSGARMVLDHEDFGGGFSYGTLKAHTGSPHELTPAQVYMNLMTSPGTTQAGFDFVAATFAPYDPPPSGPIIPGVPHPYDEHGAGLSLTTQRRDDGGVITYRGVASLAGDDGVVIKTNRSGTSDIGFGGQLRSWHENQINNPLYIPLEVISNLLLHEDLTVEGATSLAGTSVTGQLDVTGAIDATGGLDVGGNAGVAGNLHVTGRSTKTLRDAVGLRSNANQSIPNNVLTWCVLGDETFRADITVQQNTAAAGGTIATINSAGLYLIQGFGQWLANATGRRNMRIQVDTGAGFTDVLEDDRPGGTGVSPTNALFHIMSLAAGDRVRLAALQNSGAALNLQWSPRALTLLRLV